MAEEDSNYEQMIWNGFLYYHFILKSTKGILEAVVFLLLHRSHSFSKNGSERKSFRIWGIQYLRLKTKIKKHFVRNISTLLAKKIRFTSYIFRSLKGLCNFERFKNFLLGFGSIDAAHLAQDFYQEWLYLDNNPEIYFLILSKIKPILK